MSTASSIYIFIDLCLIDKTVLKGNIKAKFHLNSLKIEPMKNSFEFWLAKKIARTMLFIKATTFKKLSEEPYTWACGMLMRIYNDNRMMLGNYKHRMRITLGFANLIKEKEINPDYIIGTMTSGIAPAASLAQYLGKELLINYNGDYYLYQKNLSIGIDLRISANNRPDIIIATSPFAIPYGVQIANELGISFAYIRNKEKDHGKKMQVEGIIKPGMKYAFLFCNELVSEVCEFTHILEHEFKLKFCITCDVRGHEKVDPSFLKDKEAVVIEDLFSTGGSSAYEVYGAREKEMTCNYCFSIFSYGFDCLKKQFSGENNIGNKGVKLSKRCNINSLLTFSILRSEIERLKFYKPDVIKEMRNEIEGFDKKYEKFLNKKS